MFTETRKDRDDVIGIVCEGDLERMHALLHERLTSVEKPGLVVDLTNFQGYAGPAAMREDLKMDIAHRNDFSRIAVVGDAAWQQWGTTFAKALTHAEMRWFDASALDAAAEWAGGV